MSTATTTARSTEDGALRWFRRLMWAGIIGNVIVGIVSIAYTPQVLALAKVDPATPLVWPRLSAMLVMLLAGFYIPAAIDPNAHRFSAVFAVVCRFAGTIFTAVVGRSAHRVCAGYRHGRRQERGLRFTALRAGSAVAARVLLRHAAAWQR